MTKKMVRWEVMVVGTVMVIMQTAKATTIDMASSDLTTMDSMNTVEVNMNTQGEVGFSRGMNTYGQEGFSRGMNTIDGEEGFSRGTNIGRDERGCRRKNGQVR